MLPTPTPAGVGAIPGPTPIVVGLSTLVVPSVLAVRIGVDERRRAEPNATDGAGR